MLARSGQAVARSCSQEIPRSGTMPLHPPSMRCVIGRCITAATAPGTLAKSPANLQPRLNPGRNEFCDIIPRIRGRDLYIIFLIS